MWSWQECSFAFLPLPGNCSEWLAWTSQHSKIDSPSTRPASALSTLIGSSSVTCSRLCHWTTSARWLLFPVLRKLGLEAPFSFSRRNKTQIATRWRCLSLISDEGLLSVLGGRGHFHAVLQDLRSKQTPPTSWGEFPPQVVFIQRWF